MATATLSTAPQRFTPEQLEPLFELIDGVPREKTPMGLFANVLASYLASAINQFSLPKKLGMAINETPYKVNDKNSRRPDVSYVEFAKFPALEVLIEDPPLLEFSPNIAVEVVSPSNTVSEMEKRIVHYFATGVQVVWIVHPQMSRIYVYETAKACKILEINDVLDGGNVLPGFSLKLCDLFSIPGIPA